MEKNVSARLEKVIRREQGGFKSSAAGLVRDSVAALVNRSLTNVDWKQVWSVRFLITLEEFCFLVAYGKAEERDWEAYLNYIESPASLPFKCLLMAAINAKERPDKTASVGPCSIPHGQAVVQ